MHLDKINQDFTSILEENLNHSKDMQELLSYACLPAGKLFRPQLVYALAHDLNGFNNDHKLLAAAIEVHHAYTLVHDDLPCMDDDDMRRGKPSLHKIFGEWKAVLTGDALMALSFELLSKMQSDSSLKIIQHFAKYTGKDGLILGQFLDLSHANDTFEKLCLLHSLKTGKLISFSLEASHILTKDEKVPHSEIKKLGISIGLLFQLIDDLSELNEETDAHEEDINAFLNFDPLLVEKRIIIEHNTVINILAEYKLNNLLNIYTGYLDKMLKPLDFKTIEKLVKIDLKEIKSLVN
jgi:geranylgeranyl diphosphate synthase type II